MSVQREGGCACGEVRYRLTSEPLFTHCCHCLNCQRQTGSAFVINLLIETDRVEVLAGDPQPVDVPRDDGSTQRIFRCPACQVAVFSEYGRPAGAVRPRRHARRPLERGARRPHLHQVEGGLGHAPGVGAGVRGVLRHESPVAGCQSRAGRGGHGAGALRRLRLTLGALRWLDDSELRIGLGCMRLSTGEPLAEEDVHATIAAAAEAGITVFDTARAYGDNEAVLARALRACGAHERARIVTKAG